jgi:hypothetical protein
VARCQAEANKTLFRPKNEVFSALCIFQPIIIRKSVGDKVKSPACYIDGYVHPTVLNWQSFFMGTDERLADAIIDILNPRSRSLLSPPTAGTIMLAPALESDPDILQPTPAVVTGATPSVEDQLFLQLRLRLRLNQPQSQNISIRLSLRRMMNLRTMKLKRIKSPFN